MNTGNFLAKRARLTPTKEALFELDTGVRYSYAELNERANRAGNWLLKQGIQMGDRVSILAHNCIAYFDIFFACGKIGAIFTPLNWRLTANELSYIVADCAPKALFFGDEFAGTTKSMRPNIAGVVEQIVPLSSYQILINEQAANEPPSPQLDGETPYCILYTSGTTGKPKGAIIPHRQVLWNAINTITSWGLTEKDVSPIFTPLFHAGGLFAFMTPLLYLGGRLILSKGFDPEESLQVILQEKCTVILGVPTLFQMWLNSPAFATADFSHVHFFISGGAPCPAPLMEAWRNKKGVVFRQGYGLTEVGPNCFSMTDAESVPKSGSVGKPIFHSEMRLVNENGQDVAVGETGELLIRGPHMCAGYWRNEPATRDAIREGWFHTGDMARMDEDGFFTIAGRLKDMIISGGENIYAAEVEAVFHEHPAVAEAALIGKPDAKWGEVGLMIVALQKGGVANEGELLDFCRQRLARYKVPREIIFTQELPHSPYGKVEKVKLREKYL